MKKTIIFLSAMTFLVSSGFPIFRLEARAKKSKTIPVRADGHCDKPCIVLGKVNRFKHTIFGTCSKKLGEYASKEYGADAILKYVTKPAGEAKQHICEGIAVRWAKEGENGISQITDETPIPILEK